MNDSTEVTPTEPVEGSDTSEGVESDSDSSGNGSWRPADHYAEPPAASRFPRWVTFGCGGVSVLILLGMVAVGLFFQSGGLASFIGMAIGQFQGEARNMFEDDVSEEARKSLDESLRTVRKKLTDGEVEQSVVLPLLQKISVVQKDRKISTEEASELQELVQQMLEAPPGKLEGPASE